MKFRNYTEFNSNVFPVINTQPSRSNGHQIQWNSVETSAYFNIKTQIPASQKRISSVRIHIRSIKTSEHRATKINQKIISKNWISSYKSTKTISKTRTPIISISLERQRVKTKIPISATLYWFQYRYRVISSNKCNHSWNSSRLLMGFPTRCMS